MITKQQTELVKLGLLERRLQDDEILLWQGQPRFGAYARRRLLLACLFLLPMAWVAAWQWTDMLFRMSHGSPHAAKLLTQIIAWLVRLGFYAVFVWSVVKSARNSTENTRYALTTKRIVVMRPSFSSLSQAKYRIDDAALYRLCPILHSNYGRESRQGTITFGSWLFGVGAPLAFRDIDNAEAVFQQLVNARAAQPETALYNADRSNYASRAQSGRPAFIIEEHLWGGEELLWQGKSNQREYMRNTLVGTVVMAFLLLLLYVVFASLARVITLDRFLAVAIGLAVLLYPIVWWGMDATYRRTFYFLTNQRVIIVKADRRRSKLDDKPLQQTRGAKVTQIRHGTATLEFERAVKPQRFGTTSGIETFVFSFDNIDHWTEVLNLIKQAREKLEVRRREIFESIE